MMIVWIVAHQHELSAAQAMINDIARQDEQLQVHAARKATMEEERARLEEHDKLVEQLSCRTHLAVVLGDLSRRLPETTMLTTLNIASPGLMRFASSHDAPQLARDGTASIAPPRTAPAIVVPVSLEAARPQLTLAGIARSAQDVIRFAALLESSPLFDRVQIQSQGAAEWAGRRVEKFEITCDLLEQGEGSS